MIFDLNPELAMFIVRLGLGIVFLAHGPAKLMKSKEMSKTMGMSANMIMMTGAMETLGALSMILGLRVDIGAILLILVMLGGIYFKTQKWEKKFTGGMGWELDFILLVAALSVLLNASSAYSVF